MHWCMKPHTAGAFALSNSAAPAIPFAAKDKTARLSA